MVEIENFNMPSSKIRISKYEYTNLISTRAYQISQGYPSLIKCTGYETAEQVAKQEFKNGILPLKLVKTLPNGDKIEYDSECLVYY